MAIDFNANWTSKVHSNPFNWTGSKHRYLSDLFEVLPVGKDLKILDPFVGGGDLISKLPIDWDVTASDLSDPLIWMHRSIKKGVVSSGTLLTDIEKRGLSKTSDDAYLKLRDEYNKCPSSHLLYLLICHSNTNRMRFNKYGGFNVSFGERTFNDQLIKKLDNYQRQLFNRKVEFSCVDFDFWDFEEYDLLLLDGPYPNTSAVYNEQGGWTFNQELKLYSKTSDAASNGSKFIFFGQTWSKGVNNDLFERWANQYNVKVLQDTTSGCSSNRKGGKTVEIMAWN